MQTVNYSNNDKESAHSCTSSQFTGDLSNYNALKTFSCSQWKSFP